ncbi:hypothetical protein WN944_019689 [Citrus x changshan-huyou]|uniref:Uncharacterized protein n=1 Tax=Citrus x changshan-huyou TaxID=2935761 RepID=A0AAP0LVS0_9ROSI
MAYLNEMQAAMLRKHLLQLGQYLEGEEFENNCGLRPEEQDIEYDDNGICTFVICGKRLDSLFYIASIAIG